ncbi:MAG: hypothetical protein IIA88_12115 [Bacteroidetes bacterium]|nr:hypothetical protein [Bacteroidota bacterium]
MKNNSTQITWYQLLILASIMATFMGAGIAIAAYFNGKHIKEGVLNVTEILERMDKTAEQRDKDVIKILEKIDQRLEKMDYRLENQTKMLENQTKMLENQTKMLAKMY